LPRKKRNKGYLNKFSQVFMPSNVHQIH
jgi:hypothetical protein